MIVDRTWTGGGMAGVRSLGQQGFTLVEMAVTLAIIGLLAAVAIPSFRTFVPRARLERSASGLANELAMARMAAIAKSTSFQVIFNTSGKSYTIQQLVNGTWATTGQTTVPSALQFEVKYEDDTPALSPLELRSSGTTSVPIMKQRLFITFSTEDGTAKRRVGIGTMGTIATEKWAGGVSWVAG